MVVCRVLKKQPRDSEAEVLAWLSWCGIWEKRLLFHSPAQTRLQWEKLMAMINDKGPEESRDTDATYIILSHQSVHLPGPSRQRGGGGGRGERRGRRRWRGERERAIYSRSFTHRNCFSLSSCGESEKNKWQRGDKVNKKMACKVTGRYSVREGESEWGGEGESSPWSFLISSNLTLRMPKPHFQGLICHMVCPV